jgi:hypothetical protein
MHVHGDDKFGAHMIPQRTATTPFVTMMFAAVVIFFACNQVSYARKGAQTNYTVYNNTRIIQSFLKRAVNFTGKIDGICRTETETAIRAYIDTLSQKPNGAPCSAQFLNALIDTIMSSAADAIRRKNDAPADSLSSTLKRIEDNIVNEIRETRSDIMSTLIPIQTKRLQQSITLMHL